MFWNDGWVVVVMSNMAAGAMALVKKARELIATERSPARYPCAFTESSGVCARSSIV
jgi:hypothetical protein